MKLQKKETKLVCLIFGINHESVSENSCFAETSQPHKNKEYCQKSQCPHGSRLCPSCIEQGAHTHPRNRCNSVDIETGLCDFHKKNGGKAMRTKPDLKARGLKATTNLDDIKHIDAMLKKYIQNNDGAKNSGPDNLLKKQIAKGKKEIRLGKLENVQELPIEDVYPDPDQPRKIFTKQAMDDLTNSIRENGQLTPALVIRVKGKEGKYMINAGERRWRACKRAGKTTYLAIIVSQLDTPENRHYSSTMENVHREDMNDLETAVAIGKIMHNFSLSLAEAAIKMGLDYHKVQRFHKILQLDISIILKMSPFRPDKEALSGMLAKKLAPLEKHRQVEFLEKIEHTEKLEGKKMQVSRACLLIDRYSASAGEKTRKHARGPKDDYRLIGRGIKKMEDTLTILKDLGQAGIAKAFESRSRGETLQTLRAFEAIKTGVEKTISMLPK